MGIDYSDRHAESPRDADICHLLSQAFHIEPADAQRVISNQATLGALAEAIRDLVNRDPRSVHRAQRYRTVCDVLHNHVPALGRIGLLADLNRAVPRQFRHAVMQQIGEGIGCEITVALPVRVRAAVWVLSLAGALLFVVLGALIMGADKETAPSLAVGRRICRLILFATFVVWYLLFRWLADRLFATFGSGERTPSDLIAMGRRKSHTNEPWSRAEIWAEVQLIVQSAIGTADEFAPDTPLGELARGADAWRQPACSS